MPKVTVVTDMKSFNKLVKNECQNFAIYLRDNWQPYESISNDMWWNEKTNHFVFTYDLYFMFKSQSKDKVNAK